MPAEHLSASARISGAALAGRHRAFETELHYLRQTGAPADSWQVCLASEDGMEDSESAARCAGGSFKGKPASNQRLESAGGHQQWPAQPESDLKDRGGRGSFLAGHCMPFETAACVSGELTSAFPRISGDGTCGRCRLLVEARNLDFLGWHHHTLACFELPICNRCFVPPLSQGILVCHSASHLAGFCRSIAGQYHLRTWNN